MNFESPPISAYFSDNYQQGRQYFLDKCAARNIPVHSFPHPEHKGPCGEILAMDCALVGNKKASKILLLTCGTHGLESAAGAATLLQFLDHDLSQTLPADTALLMVHGVNPYGWAYARRGNEDGIDLNRNCLDHAKPYPQNPAYERLHKIIKQAHVDAAGLEEFTKSFAAFAESEGMARAIDGVTAGQYSHPDGMSFGGHALSWSWQTLFSIADTYLRHAEKIIHIDWHTGIGDFAEPFFITDMKKDSAHYRLAEKWWAPHKIHADDILAGSAPNYTGMLVCGLRDHMAGISKAEMLSVVIEWGTYDMLKMLQALLLDDWLKQYGTQDTDLVREARNLLIERFCPQSPKWRQNVLRKSLPIYQQTLTALKSW